MAYKLISCADHGNGHITDLRVSPGFSWLTKNRLEVVMDVENGAGHLTCFRWEGKDKQSGSTHA